MTKYNHVEDIGDLSAYLLLISLFFNIQSFSRQKKNNTADHIISWINVFRQNPAISANINCHNWKGKIDVAIETQQ